VLLKRLTLVGFKSFADRTRLEFDAGVNVVVGPNGTGKSNILDAIAWVMGTQATRALRTQKMEDVVFAGTATRPALSRAEVALTFDNSDGFLPLDLNEITITRRLYRDGTSEYELNRAPCRLLDIQDLLFDGGVGRHQHVLVSQGQIGDILNARPDEHQAVIEEAAGITKHRGRRDRAVRRLEQTGLDVERLNDILHEKRRSLRPLKRQANAAQRYDRVKTEARALRTWHGGEELRTIRSTMEAANGEQTELERSLAEDRERLDDLMANLADYREAAGEVDRALERDTAAAARLETVAERLKRIDDVARERRRALEGRLEGAGERREDLDQEAADLEREIEAVDRAERDGRVDAERKGEALQHLEDEERSLAEQAQLPTEGVVANLRGDLRALDAVSRRDLREVEATRSRREVVGARLEDETAEAVTLNHAIQGADAEVSVAQRTYEEARLVRVAAQESWEESEEHRAEIRLTVAGAQARVDAIGAALADAGDPEARARTEANGGVVGTVASLLDVPPEAAVAVDGALGAWSDAYLASDREVVHRLAERLKAEGLGGVSLLAGLGEDGDVPARSVAAALGIDALVDLLGPAADRGLAARLLGDVVFVAGWAAGWSVVAEHPDIRAVTPEGDVISAIGMRIAQPDGSGPAALEAARVEAEIAERDLARLESQRVTTRRAFDVVRETERTSLEALEALEARIAGHTEALALIGRARAEGEAELARLDERTTALREAEATRSARIEDLRERLSDFEGEEATRQAAWEELNRRREVVASRRDEARRSSQEAAAALAGATERKRMLVRRLERVVAERGQLELLPDHDTRIERLVTVEERATRLVGLVQGHVAELRVRQRSLREESGRAGERLMDAEGRREVLDGRISEGRDRMSVLAVKLAELRVRDEAVAEGLRRDVDMSEEDALAAPRPELDEDVDPRDRLNTLEADLRRMGAINPLAAAEYEELSAEVEVLESQLADLDESRRELQKVIAALDAEMAALFTEAFEEINGFYEENFALVFPGGRGRLRLIDSDRPLESGVEVEAQPHGKKVGRLSLLSGGERSLAALAFLFAVFRARPSPFYVLDEVEAALDDANLHRFLRLVDTLRRSAQLVIITHQQQTMEAADMLYGVTMEPGASSKIISKRMSPVIA
jgi:chromosome segregation protein